MAMGMRTASVAGDWLPIVKFDARSGRLFRIDKVDGQSVPTEIPLNTAFGVDFGTLEAGYVFFSVQEGPVRRMVPYHAGVDMPSQPAERDEKNKMLYRPGFWIKIIGAVFAIDAKGDGMVREWCSSASSLLNAMDDLYERYRVAPEAAQGMIPSVAIIGANPIKTGSGTRTSTNYAPIFEIRKWAPRPEQFLGPRTTPIPGQEPFGGARNGNGQPLPPTPPVAAPPPPVAPPPVAEAPNWMSPAQQPPVQQQPPASAPVQKAAAATPDSMPF
jgi:hypothetical protein